jgi:hypothetical protein
MSRLLTLGAGGPVNTFSPIDLSPWAWYRADQGVYTDTSGTVPAGNGDAVAHWADLSGNGRHVIQNTSGSRPALVTSNINSLPAIRSDGTDDHLETTAVLPGTATAFFVARRREQTTTSASAIRVVMGSDVSGNGGFYAFTNRENHATPYVLGCAVLGSASSPNATWAQDSVIYATWKWDNVPTPDTQSIAPNADPPVTVTTNLGLGSGFLLLSEPNNSVRSIAADLAEVIVYSGTLDSTDTAKVTAYLSNRYAL